MGKQRDFGDEDDAVVRIPGVNPYGFGNETDEEKIERLQQQRAAWIREYEDLQERCQKEHDRKRAEIGSKDAEIAHLKNWIAGLCDFDRVMTEKVDEIAKLKAEIGSKDAEIAYLRSGAAIRRLDKALSAKDAEIAKFKEESATCRDTGSAVVQNLKSDVSAKAAEIDLVVRALNSEDPAGIDALPETLRDAVKEAVRKARTLSFIKAAIGIF